MQFKKFIEAILRLLIKIPSHGPSVTEPESLAVINKQLTANLFLTRRGIHVNNVNTMDPHTHNLGIKTRHGPNQEVTNRFVN
jgi:hypothetical protein